MNHACPSVGRHRRRHTHTCLLAALVLATPPSTAVAASLRPRRGRTSPAFLPRWGGTDHRRRRRIGHPLAPALGLRGGGDESEVDVAANDEEIIDASFGEQPVVDVSVVEGGDATSHEAVEEEEAGVDISLSDDGEADMSRAQEVDDADEDAETDVAAPRMQGEPSRADEAVSPSASNDESLSETSDADDSPSAISEDDAVPPELAARHADLRAAAADRRADGKALHDAGDLGDAAEAFNAAAALLDEALSMPLDDDDDDIAVERATCRLHEALCLLKAGRPGECVEACSDVLGDGVRAVPLDAEDEGADAGATESQADATEQTAAEPTQTLKVISPGADAPPSAAHAAVPPPIRARAYHRRAKARLALDDRDGALEDARDAAFLGDRNAVQFYGRLLREEGSGTGVGAGDAMPGAVAPFGSTEGAGTNPFLEGLLGGMGGRGHPLMPSTGAGAAGANDFSSSLLSSLLTSGTADGAGGGGDGSPLGFMGELLAPPPSGKGKSKRHRRGKKKTDGLAKSVLSSLAKRIEDEATQETICAYLQSTNAQQIMQFAAMAGIPLKEESARRLAALAGGVTPRGIRKSVARAKRGISIVTTVRKVLKVVDKYKAVIILAVLLYWIRSAVREPYPVSRKRARKVAEQAALGFAIAPARPGRSLGALCGSAARAVGRLYLGGSMDIDEGRDRTSTTGIEEELERLQNQLTLIEALEERNKAQSDSFVDEEDQWDSLEEEERELLSGKAAIVQKMEALAEELVLLFMGEKMKDG